jgi:predicted nucleic acid-binding protein
MKPIGLDASVVVRLLVGAPEGQAQAARRRLEKAFQAGEEVLVCDLVVAEAYHALHYHYGVPKEEARELLVRFLRSGAVSPDPASVLELLGEAGSSGLVDRMIHQRYHDRGASTFTFDERQGRLEGAVELKE